MLSTEVRGLQLGVLDAANTTLSRRLVADLAAERSFVPHAYASRDSLDHAIVAGEVSAAMVIPPDFDRQWRRAVSGGELPQLQVIYDGAEAVLAGNAEAFLRSIVAASVAAGGGAGATRQRGARHSCGNACRLQSEARR